MNIQQPMRYRSTRSIALVLFVSTVVRADESEGKRFFDVIQPLLNAKCVSCHGPDEQEANLRLDSLTAALRGGDSGPAIVPGDADGSLLVKAIRDQGDVSEMPPKEKLADQKIEAVTKWFATDT